jgi:hypothetical protein
MSAGHQDSSVNVVVADLSENDTVVADDVDDLSLELVQAHQNQSHALIDQHQPNLCQLCHEVAERLLADRVPDAYTAIIVSS